MPEPGADDLVLGGKGKFIPHNSSQNLKASLEI